VIQSEISDNSKSLIRNDTLHLSLIIPATFKLSVIGPGTTNIDTTQKRFVGDTVRLKATPKLNSNFIKWSGIPDSCLIKSVGGADSLKDTLGLILPEQLHATAVFERRQTHLTVAVVGNGFVDFNNGTAQLKRDTIIHTFIGDTAILKAKPIVGYEFSGWKGDSNSQTDSIAIIFSDSFKVTAEFAKKKTTIKIQITGSGKVEYDTTRTYRVGDTILLTPKPAFGYKFQKWSGQKDSLSPLLSAVLKDTLKTTAVFTRISSKIKVSIAGEGQIRFDVARPYFVGDTVGFRALPGAGYCFLKWQGIKTDSTQDTVSIILTDTLQLIAALFVKKAAFIKILGNENGVVEYDANRPYWVGDTIKLTAKPDPDFVFDKWSGFKDSLVNPLSIVLPESLQVTALFARPIATLKVLISGNGKVRYDSTRTYRIGDTVYLKAIPTFGNVFLKWDGADLDSTKDSTQLVLYGSTQITACFAKPQVSVKVGISGKGAVSYDSSRIYRIGDTLKLIPVPSFGYEFQKWGGISDSTQNPLSVVLKNSFVTTATFVRTIAPLKIAISGHGTVQYDLSKTYYVGDTIALKAIPSAGSVFSKWQGVGSDSLKDSLSLLLKGELNITAIFNKICTLVVYTDGLGTTNLSKDTVRILTAKEGSEIPISAITGSIYLKFNKWRSLSGRTLFTNPTDSFTRILISEVRDTVLATFSFKFTSTTFNQTFNNRQCRAAIQCSDGGYAITGAKDSTLWIMKLNAQGNLLWEQTYDYPYYRKSVGYSILQDSKDMGLVVTGMFWGDTGNFVLMKTDAYGNMKWGTSDVYTPFYRQSAGYSVIECRSGGYAMAGRLGQNMLLMRFESDGRIRWKKSQELYGTARANSVVEKSDGSFILAGEIYIDNDYQLSVIKIDAAGQTWEPFNTTTSDYNTLMNGWFRSYEYHALGLSMIQEKSGRCVMIGSQSDRPWLISFDGSPDINIKVDTSLPGGHSPFGLKPSDGLSMCVASDGGYILAGDYYDGGALTTMLCKINEQGSLLWNKNPTYLFAPCSRPIVIPCGDGGYFFMGFDKTSMMWTIKMDKDGLYIE